jgi:AraC-like DNA-binding protein
MYTEHKPHGDLTRQVECVWSINATAAVSGWPVRPDGCMDLWYAPGIGLAAVGTMTCERRHNVPAGAQWLGLRFQPGMARRYLGIGAAELVDAVVPLDSVMGPAARELSSRLDAAPSNRERRRILLDAVAAQESPADPVHRAIEALTRAQGTADVDWLADQAGMSARQFRRRCREEAGLGPKHLSRVLRFRRACALAARGESWLRVAVEAGYFDQAHLIRDFREFTGSTPMSVFSKTARSESASLEE